MNNLINKKAITEKVVIPVMQGAIIGGFTLAAGYIIRGALKIEEWMVHLGSLLISGWYLIYAFSAQYDKTKIFVSGNNKTVTSATPMLKKELVVVVKSPDKKHDVYSYLSGINPETLNRIAFYHTFCQGKLTFNYLHEENNLMLRQDVVNMQTILVDKSLAQYKNGRDLKRGVVLTETGKNAFLQLARAYSPTLEEKRLLSKYFRHYRA